MRGLPGADRAPPGLRAGVLRRVPGRAGARASGRARSQKKAQEIARYVLPLATHAALYHTVLGLTLLRYWRLCADLRRAPGAAGRGGEDGGRCCSRTTRCSRRSSRSRCRSRRRPSTRFYASSRRHRRGRGGRRHPRRLGRRSTGPSAGATSRLVDWKARNEETVAEAVREVLGVPARRALRRRGDPSWCWTPPATACSARR